MRIYLAAPVFSQFHRQYNRLLAGKIQELLPRSTVMLPQDFRLGPGATFNSRRYSSALFRRCMDEVANADAVIALLDGADADSGVAFEVGYARASGKPVVGVRTDYRQSQVKGLNVMLAEGCSVVICHFSFNEDFDSLAKAVITGLEKAASPRR